MFRVVENWGVWHKSPSIRAEVENYDKLWERDRDVNVETCAGLPQW